MDVKATEVKHFIVDGGDASHVFVKVLTGEAVTGVAERTLGGRELAATILAHGERRDFG